MKIAESMDEIAWFQVADLRDHEGKEGVAGDVEGFCHIMSDCNHFELFSLN
jgi:hypothetical protein